MKTLLLIYFVLLFAPFTSFAQENNTYQVLMAKGNILLNGKSITLQTVVNASQTIQISNENSYLALISKDKKEVIEVSKKGSFKLSELLKTTLTSNYERFVVDELLESNSEMPIARNRFQHMNKTGSVKDGGSFFIKLLLSDIRNRIYGDKMTIKWIIKKYATIKNIPNYKVLIINLRDSLLFEEKTQQMQIEIYLSKHQRLMKEEILILKIIPIDKNNRELENPSTVDGDAIERLSEEDHQKISQEFSAITKLKDTALAKLVEARFFEDKELYIDAINAYEDALKLSFEAKEVQKIYQFFLERNGFTVP